MPDPSSAAFAPADWIVLGAYFALLVGSGVWLSKKQSGTQDYFLAGRRMPAWAVAVSVLASSLSAATFLGAPQQSFAGDLTYISGTLGVFIATGIVAAFFIPVFYKHNVTTVYELLERRFGVRAKQTGSWAFMAGRVFASGARLYIAANALAYAMFGDLEPTHLLIAVAILTVVGILYTISGGIETVIWTDVVQTIVFLVGVVGAAIYLWHLIPAPGEQVLSALASPPDGSATKLRFIDLSFDLSKPFTLWTALTGVMLLNLAALGTDHDLAQRMLTCKTPWHGAWSAVLSSIISLPAVLLFMTVGLLLWAFYTQPALMGAAMPPPLPVGDGSRRAFLHFITTQMPPGLSGLMIAALFAVGLGSLDSALNAMSATFVNDIYMKARPARPQTHYLRVGRFAVAIWGVILGLFACVCVYWQRQGGQTFIDLALQVMVFAYSGLLASFACALFTKRGSQASIMAALATGFLVTLALEPTLLGWLDKTGVLPESGPAGAVFDVMQSLAWPWRMTLATTLAFIVAVIPAGRDAGRA